MSATQSPTPEVTVTFSVTFNFEQYHAEDELTAAPPDLMARIRDASTIEGALEISDASSSLTRIVDELAPWIQNLCFRAVLPLTAGESVRVQYFSRSGFLDVTPKGETIEIAGNRNPEASYPSEALLTALVDCGSRFVIFAAKAKADDEDYMANLNLVKNFEQAARMAAQPG